MIDDLNECDKNILRELIRRPENRGMSSQDLANEFRKSKVYVIQRLEYLEHRGLVFRNKFGRSIHWILWPKLRKQVAQTLGIPWKQLVRKEAADETDKVFGWPQ